MSKAFQNILQSLNPSQLLAVKAPPGPLLISAGAGSGKTKVLTSRIAYLIVKEKISPHNILAITFTNKAAREMQERVAFLIKHLRLSIHGRMWISTFHSLCARILRDNKTLIHPTGVFTIYDQTDQLSLVKKIVKKLNMNEQSYNPKIMVSHIARCKRQKIVPNDIEQFESTLGPRFQQIYHEYEEELRKAGAYDFEGLLLGAYKFFLKFPEQLEKYRNQFLHIFVDEYQDTNQIQYQIVKLLAQKHNSLCVVGDEDQSIYSWRGADISNILNFDKDFPKCRTIKLEQNYRSTKNIISSASYLIQKNHNRKHKQLFTQNPNGELIQIYELMNEHREAHLITNIIESHCRDKACEYKECAVFYRTNAQSRVLEDTFRAKGIPYKVAGGLKFYERAEIKDILAYLNFILNLKDETSLRRIINKPRRGIGASTIEKIDRHAHHLQKSFYETLLHVLNNNQLTGVARNGVTHFVQTIEYLRNKMDNISLSDFYKAVLDKTGYMDYLKEDNSIEATSRIDNLQELANVIAQFEEENKEVFLENFLETMALLTPSDEVSTLEDSVTLMTLHVSKGLEFNMVFMAGMEEGLFPVSHSMGRDDIEEERRLAYVGMTRAKQTLVMSYSIQRHKFGVLQYNTPSQFLKDIPPQFTNFTSYTNYKKGLFRSKLGFSGSYSNNSKKHTPSDFF